MRILEIIHSRKEYPFNNIAFYSHRGDRVDRIVFPDASAAPNPQPYAAVIVYGGAMSAYDDDASPWIADELRFLETCLARGIPLLGLCLGSQLIARLLGARVYRSPRPEFGFKRITLTEAGLRDRALGPLGRSSPDRGFWAIEWHSDAWDLPEGAELLASSAGWSNQAFRYGGSVLATQFHLEFTQAHLDEALRDSPEGLPSDPERQDPREFAASSCRLAEVARSMDLLLSAFLGGGSDPAAD